MSPEARAAPPLLTLDLDGVICSPPLGVNMGIHRGFLEPAAGPTQAHVPPRWLSALVDPPRFEVGLPVVLRLQQPQLVGVRVHQVRQLPQKPRPLVRVHPPPAAVTEGRARRRHRAVDVLCARLGDLGDDLVGGRVDGREGGAVFWIGPFVPDPEAGADRYAHSLARRGWLAEGLADGIAGARLQLPENSGLRFST